MQMSPLCVENQAILLKSQQEVLNEFSANFCLEPCPETWRLIQKQDLHFTPSHKTVPRRPALMVCVKWKGCLTYELCLGRNKNKNAIQPRSVRRTSGSHVGRRIERPMTRPRPRLVFIKPSQLPLAHRHSAQKVFFSFYLTIKRLMLLMSLGGLHVKRGRGNSREKYFLCGYGCANKQMLLMHL